VRWLGSGVLLLLTLTAPASRAGEPASVLVTTAMPQRGEVPEIVTAYGVARPAASSSQTISLQAQGRVLRLEVTPGEAVKAGQVLLEFGPTEAALKAYQQAVTALRLAKSERARLGQLFSQQLATRDQVAQAEKASADAQAALDALQKEGAAKPNMSVAAPFDGIVTTIPVAQGDAVAPGTALMTLVRAAGMIVTAGIEPAQRQRVQVGDAVQLQSLTDGSAPVSGTVRRVDGLLNLRTRLVDADVATQASLLSGAAYRADIRVGTFTGWVLPRDAVLADAQGAHVFQAVSGKAARVPARIVGSRGGESVIDGPIQPDQPLILKGSYQLQDGMAIRVAASEAGQP
jgi:membrane fusion protein, multidrug efflux system